MGINDLRGTAIVLADDFVAGEDCKTTHALIRKSLKFKILGIIDEKNTGADAGELLDGINKGIPVLNSVKEMLKHLDKFPDYFIVGIATNGGVITPYILKHGIEALNNGITMICGLHNFISENSELIAAAKVSGAELIDIRKSRPRNELKFWQGDILKVRAPRIAVIGTDCNLGKRTTTQFLIDKCLETSIKAEMIFTGQSGWLQGGKYGFILDTTINDFVSGEIENAIVFCDKKENPDVIFLEGQSALRNPMGPCGSELIVSGNAAAVILQYGPGYKYFQGLENIGWEIGSIQDEITLVELYGSKVIAITLNLVGIDSEREEEIKLQLKADLNIPVVNVLKDGVNELIPLIEEIIEINTKEKS
tara:strand:- start:5337 stop:6428 length:1092 start_codon:yes stop_codon:yes gene_type:complete